MNPVYQYFYHTPAGFSDLWMRSDGEFLTGLWFDQSEMPSQRTGRDDPDIRTDRKTSAAEGESIVSACRFSDAFLLPQSGFQSDRCSQGGKCHANRLLPIFDETADWLDTYFQGKDPGWLPKYKIDQLTLFRQEVIDILLTIPFGQTIAYGEIARELARRRGISKMSPQAVGGAVGWNPVCIMIPCHRVIGANGALTGYHGGIQNKTALLKLEGHDLRDSDFLKKSI